MECVSKNFIIRTINDEAMFTEGFELFKEKRAEADISWMDKNVWMWANGGKKNKE